ncbi:MAG: transglutaminase family protein [Gammaproteobacteria bacterium]|nr:transglutaminase family protein [Gammaproteobacteria bacterium]
MSPAPVRYKVVHETRYAYEHPVSSGRHLAHLSPRETTWQKILSHRIELSPEATEQSWASDYFGNRTLRFTHESMHRELLVRADSEVSVYGQLAGWDPEVPWDRDATPPGTRLGDDPALAEFRIPSPHVPLLAAATDYARKSFPAGRPLVAALQELTLRIREDFVYDPLATTISTPVAEVEAKRRGVCQDFAHFMLSGLRGLGLPARYMSGYIINERVPGAPALQGADTSHAWVAARCPVSGWIGCDPTNGKFADTEFITLSWGRDFSDITPLRGVLLGAGTHVPRVAVRITRQ